MEGKRKHSDDNEGDMPGTSHGHGLCYSSIPDNDEGENRDVNCHHRASKYHKTSEHEIQFQPEGTEVVETSDSNGSVLIDTNNSSGSETFKALELIEVLEVIVQFLPSKDLTSTRLVSKLWNDASIPQLRKRHKIFTFDRLRVAVKLAVINVRPRRPGARHRPIKCGDDNDIKLGLADFVSAMSTSPNIPYGKYQMESFLFQESCTTQFFTICGNLITQLKIRTQSKHELSTVHLKELLFKYAPNLVKLEIDSTKGGHLREFGWYKERLYNEELGVNKYVLPSLRSFKLTSYGPIRHSAQAFQTFLIDMLKIAVNLESLEIHHRFSAPYGLVNPLVLVALKEKKELGRLKTLKLDEINLEDLKVLEQLSQVKPNTLVLTEFDIGNIYRLDINQEMGFVLGQFLALQANNLKKLICGHLVPLYDLNSRQQPRTNIPVILPEFKQVTLLQLNIAPYNYFDWEFQSFTKNFPQLQSLKIITHNEEIAIEQAQQQQLNAASWDRIMRINQLPSANNNVLVTSLDVNNIHSVEQLVQLSTLFPNVIKLEIELMECHVLGQLWNKWPGLKRLNLMLGNNGEVGQCIDEYMTGIEAEHHSRLISALNKFEGDWDYKYGIIKSSKALKINHGIIDLKCLKELTLRGNENVFITDLTAYFGFTQLNNSVIERIHVFSGRNEVSSVCASTLSQVLGTSTSIILE